MGEALGFIFVIGICILPIYIGVKIDERKQKKKGANK